MTSNNRCRTIEFYLTWDYCFAVMLFRITSQTSFMPSRVIEEYWVMLSVSRTFFAVCNDLRRSLADNLSTFVETTK